MTKKKFKELDKSIRFGWDIGDYEILKKGKLLFPDNDYTEEDLSLVGDDVIDALVGRNFQD